MGRKKSATQCIFCGTGKKAYRSRVRHGKPICGNCRYAIEQYGEPKKGLCPLCKNERYLLYNRYEGCICRECLVNYPQMRHNRSCQKCGVEGKKVKMVKKIRQFHCPTCRHKTKPFQRNRKSPGFCELCERKRDRVHKNKKTKVPTCCGCRSAELKHGKPHKGECPQCGNFKWLIYKYWRFPISSDDWRKVCRDCYASTLRDHKHLSRLLRQQQQ